MISFGKNRSLEKHLEAKAREEFFQQISRFSSFLSPILEAHANRHWRALRLLLRHLRRNMSPTPALQAYYDSKMRLVLTPVRKARIWLNIMECWGLQHDPPGAVLIIDQENVALYNYLKNAQPREGGKMKELYSAWWTEETLIRRGMAEIL